MIPPPLSLETIKDVNGNGKIDDKESLPVVTENNQTYHAVKDRLRTLQDWAREQLELFGRSPQ